MNYNVQYIRAVAFHHHCLQFIDHSPGKAKLVDSPKTLGISGMGVLGARYPFCYQTSSITALKKTRCTNGLIVATVSVAFLSSILCWKCDCGL